MQEGLPPGDPRGATVSRESVTPHDPGSDVWFDMTYSPVGPGEYSTIPPSSQGGEPIPGDGGYRDARWPRRIVAAGLAGPPPRCRSEGAWSHPGCRRRAVREPGTRCPGDDPDAREEGQGARACRRGQPDPGQEARGRCSGPSASRSWWPATAGKGSRRSGPDALRPGAQRRDDARALGLRPLPDDQVDPPGAERPGDPPDLAGQADRHHPGPRVRRRQLRQQAVRGRLPDQPHPQPARQPQPALRQAGSQAATGVEMAFMGERFTITCGKAQILDFLASTFEDFVRAKQREYESVLVRQKQSLEAEAQRIREDMLLRERESLRESRQFLQSTLDALSTQIAILDESGEIIAVNAAWGRAGDGATRWSGRPAARGRITWTPADRRWATASRRRRRSPRASARCSSTRATSSPWNTPATRENERRWFSVRATRFRARSRSGSSSRTRTSPSARWPRSSCSTTPSTTR